MTGKAILTAAMLSVSSRAFQRRFVRCWKKGWSTPEEIDQAVKLTLGIRLSVVKVVQTNDFTGLDLVYDIMRSEAEFLKKRDRRYLNLLDFLEKIKAFERV